MCVVMWKVLIFWFFLRLNVDVQQYFINSVAVASHPVCPPLNRKTLNSGSGSNLWSASGKVMVWVEEEIRCKAELPAHCPFMSYLLPLFLFSLFCLLFCNANSVNLACGLSLHVPHLPEPTYHPSSSMLPLCPYLSPQHVPCQLSLCCLVHRTFLILLPSLMVMWWLKNVTWFYLGRRVDERHGREGISWDSDFSLYVRTTSWRTTLLCFFLQATNWAWKRLIYHIDVDVLWVLPVLCSLSNLISSVYLPVESCFVVHPPVF